MFISIIIPIAKEGSDLYYRILSFYKNLSILAYMYNFSFEILLVSDILHKPTIRAMMMLAKENIARCFFLTCRIGKGGSIKNAVPYANGGYIILLDADIPVQPQIICWTVLLARRLKLSLVVANRVYRTHNLLRRVLSIAYNTLVNILFKTGLRDHQAGFKVLDRKAAKLILVGRTRTDGLTFDSELIVWARKLGLKYGIVNVLWREQRERSTILPLRALLTMLADLIMLRILTLTRRCISLQRLFVGHVIELKNMHVVGREFMTVIKTSGLREQILKILRKLYVTIAFRNSP